MEAVALHFTGTQINYYFHCHRQLWFFSHDIHCEQESDVVYLGKVIHETSYERERKEIEIDNLKLDFLDIRDGVLHEVKKSDSWSKAHEWQVIYYLCVLKSKGVTLLKGELNYPVIRKTITVLLTREKEQQMVSILHDIERIISEPKPPRVLDKRSVCRLCSYFELCYV